MSYLCAGPENWPRVFAACNGPRQSPIDLDVFDMSLETMAKVVFSNFDQKGRVRCTLRNNGHTVTVTFQGFQAYLYGGPVQVWSNLQVEIGQNSIIATIFPLFRNFITNWKTEQTIRLSYVKIRKCTFFVLTL